METLELGGNIQLTGFNQLDRQNMVVVKKIVGQYAKKFSETLSDFEQLTVTLKNVHGPNQFEMHSRIITGGRPTTSEITERNLFFALDKVLKKLENQH